MKRLIQMTALAGLCAAPVAAAPPTLTLKATPTVVLFGGSTTLSGVLSTKRSGQSVDILAQECGQTALKKIASVTSTSGGAFAYLAKPIMHTTYQAKQKGATSPTVTVKVAPLLVLRKARLGKFSVLATAAQSFVGKYVVFQRLRNAKWVSLKKVTFGTVKTTTAPMQISSATFRIKLKARLKVRAILPAAQAGACYAPIASRAIRS
jgi:hypothetical protein